MNLQNFSTTMTAMHDQPDAFNVTRAIAVASRCAPARRRGQLDDNAKSDMLKRAGTRDVPYTYYNTRAPEHLEEPVHGGG